MAFTSPYGIGYGLGAIGSGVAQGLLRGQEMAPQLRYENLRNQMAQTQYQNQQATQQALSQQNPTQIQPGQQVTPFDQPLSDLQYHIQRLQQSGQGIEASKLQAQATDMMQKQHSAAMGKAAQELMFGNTQNAQSILNNLGFKVDGISQAQATDPNTGQPVTGWKVSSGGQDHFFTNNDLAFVASNPEQWPNIFYRNQVMDYRAQQLQERKLMDYHKWTAMDEQNRIRQQQTQNQLTVGLGRNQAILGGAQARAGATVEVAKMKPEQQAYNYMTAPSEQGGLGLNPYEAQALQAQAKQNPKSVDQIVANAQKQHPDWDADAIQQFRSAIQDSVQGGVAPAAPAARRGAPRAVPKAAAPQPLPPRDQLKAGVTYSTPKGNLKWDGTKFVAP